MQIVARSKSLIADQYADVSRKRTNSKIWEQGKIRRSNRTQTLASVLLLKSVVTPSLICVSLDTSSDLTV